jgi:hypothetical protein
MDESAPHRGALFKSVTGNLVALCIRIQSARGLILQQCKMLKGSKIEYLYI